MIIACGWCRKNMGEKCPDCGERTDFVVRFGVAAFCPNPECGTFFFLRQRGGRTHTICDECLAGLVEEKVKVVVAAR